MSYQDCIAEITKAAGRPLADDELDDLLSELQKRISERQRLNDGAAFDAIVRDAADDYAKEMASAAIIQKRNAAINLKRRLETVDFIRTQFAGNEALGLEAVLVGVNKPVKGARLSAATEQNTLQRHYLAGFIADVEKTGLWKLFVRGEMDLDIARALWARNRDNTIPANVPKEATQIADVIAKWQEVARQDANTAGAWIKKMPGYIVRQSHDMHKIRDAGFDAWKAEILPRLDLDRTFEGADVDTFLRATWDGLASGVHLKTTGEPSGFKGPRNIAKRMSAERVLHFKSADDWFAYNQKFGTGSLREALLRGLEMSAQNTGLMRRIGTNPEANFGEIVKQVLAGVKDPTAKQKLSQLASGKLRNQLRELDGTTRTPVNAMGARIASNTRSLQRMAKLGAALLSQFGDIPIYASEMRYQGRTMLSGVGESIGNLFKGRGSAETREIAAMLGVYSDVTAGDVTARFSIADDDIPGAMARMQQKFFKWNGMSWWSDSQRRGALMSMSHRLALHKASAWAELDPDMKRTLGLFGLAEPEWGVISRAASKEADGREYVVPETIGDLADDAFAAVLARQGVKATPTRIKALKEEIANKLRAYFTDRMQYAVIEPDQRTRALMQRGTQRGTVEGEVFRFFGELKAFPVTVIQKAMGREIYGRGANSFGEALKNGNGEMWGMAQLILATTIFGYISMSAKDIVKGREPRDIVAALDDPRQLFKIFSAAMIQGGGMGIYGDFLFGEVKNRFGGGLVSTLTGPSIGTVEDIFDLYGRVRDGDDAAAQAFRVLISNTPFANIFYTRVVLDYLILYSIQEALSPGSLRRMERRIEKENAQKFLVRPSQAVN